LKHFGCRAAWLVWLVGCTSDPSLLDSGRFVVDLDGATLPDSAVRPRDSGADTAPPEPECHLATDCDDGDRCTLDDCIDGECLPGRSVEGYSCGGDFECGDCGPCIGICLRACERNVTDSGGCPGTETCGLEWSGCFRGCLSQAECRVYYVDLNDNGEKDDGETFPDERSDGWCDPATRRCGHSAPPSNPDVHAGAICERASDCEADGVCFPAFNGFPDGYCSKRGCDVPGLECAPGGRCQIRGVGFHHCLAACEVGREAGIPDLVLGLTGHSPECRVGYTCFWGGVPGSREGGCLPGNYNAITEPNIGELCMADSDCYSPFALGFCLSGVCSVADCISPDLPTDLCGTSECYFNPSFSSNSACLVPCTSPDECATGLACGEEISPGTTHCTTLCTDDAECQVGYSCSAVGADRVCQPT